MLDGFRALYNRFWLFAETRAGNVKYAAIRGAAVKVLEAFLPHLMGKMRSNSRINPTLLST